MTYNPKNTNILTNQEKNLGLIVPQVLTLVIVSLAILLCNRYYCSRKSGELLREVEGGLMGDDNEKKNQRKNDDDNDDEKRGLLK